MKKEVSWKKALKYELVANLVGSFGIATLFMSIFVILIPFLLKKLWISDSVITAILWILGIVIFSGVFVFGVWDTRRQLMYPEKRYSSYSSYRSYGNYVGYSDSGCDCGDGGGGC